MCCPSHYLRYFNNSSAFFIAVNTLIDCFFTVSSSSKFMYQQFALTRNAAFKNQAPFQHLSRFAICFRYDNDE